ncbi:alkaline phosphatase family protein [Candidatus Woesearchaeota archaeon]|nr:alkaline phosphatase family protein [Candidatus Woesearchaeota archaeon]
MWEPRDYNIVMILVDNLRKELFEKNLHMFKNIQTYIIDRSVSDISTILTPVSETASSLQSISTGMAPCDPGPVYFYRQTGKVLNLYNSQNPQRGFLNRRSTFFHNMPGQTAAIHLPHHGDVDNPHFGTVKIRHYLRNPVSILLNGILDNHNNAVVERYKEHLEDIDPSIDPAYFPVYDRLGHIKPDEELLEIYRKNLDKDIGRICKTIDETPWPDGGSRLEKTAIILMSDHSNSTTDENIDLNRFLIKETGLAKCSPLAQAYPETAALVYGNCIAKLYTEGTLEPGIAKDINAIAESGFVEHIILRIEQGVRVYSHSEDYGDATSDIEYHKGEYDKGEYHKGSYRIRVLDGQPFGYNDRLLKELSDNCNTAGKILELVEEHDKGTDQPLGIMGSVHLLEHRDAGEICLISNPNKAFGRTRNPRQGWPFRRSYNFNHGTFHREHCEAVFYIAGPPELKSAGIRRTAWMPDIRPTLESIMGIMPENSYDGQPLVAARQQLL